MSADAMQAARGLVELRRYEAAERVVRGALTAASDDAELLTFLAYVLSMQDRDREALEAADAAVRADPASAEAHRQRGVALISLERQGEAVKAAEETCRLDPHAPEGHLLHAAALGAAERYDEAKTAALTALDLDPGDDRALLCLGEVHLALGEVEAAEEIFQGVAGRSPDDRGALEGLARLHGRRRDWRGYLRGYLRVAEADPRSDISADLAVPLYYLLAFGCAVGSGAALSCLLGAIAAIPHAWWWPSLATAMPRCLGGGSAVGTVIVLAWASMHLGRLPWRGLRHAGRTVPCLAAYALTVCAITPIALAWAAITGSARASLLGLALNAVAWAALACTRFVHRQVYSRRKAVG